MGLQETQRTWPDLSKPKNLWDMICCLRINLVIVFLYIVILWNPVTKIRYSATLIEDFHPLLRQSRCKLGLGDPRLQHGFGKPYWVILLCLWVPTPIFSCATNSHFWAICSCWIFLEMRQISSSTSTNIIQHQPSTAALGGSGSLGSSFFSGSAGGFFFSCVHTIPRSSRLRLRPGSPRNP